MASDKFPDAEKAAFWKGLSKCQRNQWLRSIFWARKEDFWIVFDPKCQVLEVEKEIEFSALPAAAQPTLKGK